MSTDVTEVHGVSDEQGAAGEADQRPIRRRWGLRLAIAGAIALSLSVPPAAVGLEPTARERFERIRAAGPDASLAELLESVGGAPNAGFFYGRVVPGSSLQKISADPESVDAAALRPSRLDSGDDEVLMLHWDAAPAPLQHGLILLGRRPELPQAIGHWLIGCADRFWGTDSHTLTVASGAGWKAVWGTSSDMDALLDQHLPLARP